ncbi:MAG: TRAP transporter large permease [Motiliproteus sp.]
MVIVGALLILVFTLIIGVSVPFAFLASVTSIVFIYDYDPSFLLPYGYSRLNNIVLLAIPLFIISGGLINKSHIGNKLVDLVELFVGHIKGGLGAATVVSSAVFGALTGSASATLSAIGSIMFPRLADSGYPVGHSAALVANASVLGLLIPPSALMILYAWVGNQSVLASFLACFIPGIIVTVLLCVVNYALLKNNREMRVEPALSGKVFVQEFRRRGVMAIPALAMPMLILGGIYGGFVTPTEAAALSVLYVLPVGYFIYRELNRKTLWDAFLEAAITTGIVMMMLYCVMILSRLYIMEDLPGMILDFFNSMSVSPLVILLLINLVMIVIGMLMDDVSAVLLATPLLLPLALELGVSGTQFAAVVGVNLGMGNITPPTAPLLYLSGQLSGASIKDTMRPTLYMIGFAWLPTLMLVTFVPEVSLWLPRLFGLH